MLRDDLVETARKVEVGFFDGKGVWIKVPRQRSFEKTGRPPISARWLDVNKADDEEPNIRSRYVAKQMKALDLDVKRHTLMPKWTGIQPRASSSSLRKTQTEPHTAESYFAICMAHALLQTAGRKNTALC